MALVKTPLVDIDFSTRSLIGEICWGAEWSNLVNLSINFGTPSLRILREPIQVKSSSRSVQRGARRRLVSLSGAWMLWIHVAHWQIERSGECLATDASPYRTKFAATKDLNGQKIVGVYTSLRSGATRFAFDLNTTIHVKRRTRAAGDEVWLLYGPDGIVRSVCGNGRFERIRYRTLE